MLYLLMKLLLEEEEVMDLIQVETMKENKH